MVKKVPGPNRKGPKGQTNIGKKAPDVQSKKQPMPESAKAAAKKMGELMHARVRSCKKPTFR